MSETRHPELSVDQLMQRIRDEVERRRAARSGATLAATSTVSPSQGAAENDAAPGDAAAPAPVALQLSEPGAFNAQPEFHAEKSRGYHVNDLMAYHDRTFVIAAYHAVLRRAPDSDGMRHYLGNLRKGVSKIEMLGTIRYSPEGRRAGVHIGGLAVRYAVQKASRWPVVGGLVGFGAAILDLPRLQHRQRATENHVVQLAEENSVRTGDALRSVHGALRGLEAACNKLIAHDATQSGLDEACQLLRLAMDRKADRHELTTLTNHLVYLVEARLAREDLAPLEESLEAVQEAVAQVSRSKADRAAVEGAQSQAKTTMNTSLERFRQTIGSLSESKADRKDLEAVRSLLETKADRAAVDAAQAQAAAALDTALGSLQRTVESLSGTLADHADLAAAQRDAAATFEAALDQVKKAVESLAELKADRTDLEAARRDAAAAARQLEATAAEESHQLDSFYADFENRFRGTRDDIRQRQSVYLPPIRNARAGTARAPVVDLGCGRGEWLELLRDERLTARGVDLNRVFLDGCRHLKLDVTEKDAIAFLRGLKQDSVGAVTAFHLIEHLPHKTMIELFDEALRVLRPGGVAIFETPNPENLVVGALTFYNDPTHLNPLPPEPTRYMLETRGFVDTEILRLHPFDYFGDGKGASPEFAKLFSGAQDYALIGRKARK